MSGAPGQGELLAQLRQSLGLLQVAFDAATEAMLIVDPCGEVRWANQAAADLWTDGLAILLVGRRLERLLDPIANRGGHPLALDSPGHPLHQLKEGNGGGVFELRGKVLRLEWRVIPEPGEGYQLLLARDLEPQERALQLQRHFLNQLAHELHTPLAILSGSLSRLQAKATELGQKSRRWLGQAREETTRLGRLITSLMALTDLDTGRRVLCLEPSPLAPWLRQWHSQQLVPEAAELELSIDPPAETACIASDVLALEEVLAQLLDNSLRYGDGPAQIKLVLRLRGDQLQLSWFDQGWGITTEPREQVFERFVRLQEHRRPQQVDGAGLGLALASELISAMGGSLQLAPPVADQAGVEFVLFWPRLAD
jgi:signal transduction histidine kinase